MAARFVEHELDTTSLGNARSWLLGKATRTRASASSDLASYLLFGGGVTRKLIDLGHQDALDKADEIRAFFARPRGVRKLAAWREEASSLAAADLTGSAAS